MWPSIPGSGNHLVDMDDRCPNRDRDEEYCSDCKSAPCECDEIFERSRVLD